MLMCGLLQIGPLQIGSAQVFAQDATTQADQQNQTDQQNVDANLQLSWAASQNQFWRVSLRIAPNQQGTFSDLRNHCRSDLVTGAFELAADGKSVTFSPRFATPNGQLRIRYQGSESTKIIVDVEAGQRRLSATKTPSVSNSKQIPVSQLLGGTPEQQTDDASVATWSLQRVPNDALRIELADSKSYVKPDEPIAFSIGTRGFVNFVNKKLSAHYDVVRVADGKVVHQDDQTIQTDGSGNSNLVSVSVPRPDQPGAYEIRCRLSESDPSWTRFGREPESLVQTAQAVLVMADPNQKLSKSQTQSWRLLGQIQPAKRPEWELKQWLPGGNRSLRSLGGSRSGGLEQAKHKDTVVSLLDPNGTYATALPKMRVGWPHRIVLRYPSGQRLKLRVQIAGSEKFDNIHKTIEFQETPQESSKEPFHEQSFWHYPTEGSEFIRLTNTTSDEVLSFASIDVLGGPYRINTADHSVDPSQRLAVLHLADFNWVNQITADQANRLSSESFLRSSVEMHRLFLATERLQDYLKVAGYNTVSVPGNVGGNAWYSCPTFAANQSNGDRRSLLTLFMQMMDTTDLKVLVGVDPRLTLSSVESEMQLSNQPLTNWLRVRSSQVMATQYNLLNEVVQSSLISWMQHLAGQLSVHRCYSGMVIHSGRNSHCKNLTPSVIASEDTLRLIFRSTGKDTANATLAQLRTWSQSEGREIIQQWCDLQTTVARNQIAKVVPGKTLFIGVPRKTIERKSFYDVADMRRSGNGSPKVDADDIDDVDRGAIIGTAQAANGVSIPVHSLQSVTDLSKALDLVDPEVLLFSESMLTTAWHRELADAIRTFTMLPASPMRDVANSDPGMKTARVRYGLRGGTTIVSVINAAPWSSLIEMQFNGEHPWRSVLADSKEKPEPTVKPEPSDANDGTNWSANGTIIRALLEPGRTLVLASPASGADAPPMSWTSQVDGGEDALKKIQKQVTTVVERIGSLSTPDSYFALTNGSFEQVGGVGIPGWMHKQHPPDAVRIDAREASEGSSSVLLKTDAANPGRTWIVSEQLQPPQSGRLAVSMACRGELIVGNTTTHKIKVSIEGTRSTTPVRHSQEFEIPRDGKWQPRVVVLEALHIDPTTVDSIRLTIDSLSPGRVWVDDIHLHDRFSTAKERGDLQGEAFLAVQGLQQGNLTPAAQLLKNDWARHLLARKPAKPVLTIQPARAAPLRKEPPSVADRIKSWIPKPLRF